MKKIILVLCFILLFFGCSRKTTTENIILEKENNKINNEISLNLEKNNITIEENNTTRNRISLGKNVFVTSKNGLYVRSEPSIQGDIIRLLELGERIIIYEKSEELDTINNISDYWYRITYDANISEWVFGGYISEDVPSDLPIILGEWRNMNNPDFHYIFNINSKFIQSFPPQNHNTGTWALNGNELVLYDKQSEFYDFDSNSLLITERETRIFYFIISVIDNNNIIFDFSDPKNNKDLYMFQEHENETILYKRLIERIF